MSDSFDTLVNKIGNPRVREIIKKKFPNDKEAARNAAVFGVIMEDFIENGLNAILEQHINPKLDKLDLLEEILKELQKANKKSGE